MYAYSDSQKIYLTHADKMYDRVMKFNKSKNNIRKLFSIIHKNPYSKIKTTYIIAYSTSFALVPIMQSIIVVSTCMETSECEHCSVENSDSDLTAGCKQ